MGVVRLKTTKMRKTLESYDCLEPENQKILRWVGDGYQTKTSSHVLFHGTIFRHSKTDWDSDALQLRADDSFVVRARRIRQTLVA